MRRIINRNLRAVIGIAVMLVVSAAAAAKPRIVILSDISNEPDDQMSFVRLFTYANEFDLEGLIAVTSCWKMTAPDIATLRKVIEAYGKVRDNLLLHSPDYPTADYLKGIAKAGVDGFGMSAAAGQLDNEGVKLIVSVLEKNDPRPVWFLIWGGANTLGGAVMKIKNEKSNADSMIAKIRTYDIALQDDGSAYIMHSFPRACLMTSRSAWKGISHSKPGWSDSPESWGGNDRVFDAAWCSANIQQGHGALGEMYPNVMWRWEGDSPSFLYLIPNGLNFPDNPTYGGWGGRFGGQRQRNVRSGTQNDSVDPILDKHLDYELFTEARDTWKYQSTTYTDNEYCAVFRWREDFQNDFAARMDRCIKPFSGVNHAPRVIMNNDTTLGFLTIKAATGSTLQLDASKSVDPDNDSLSFSWFTYKEAGTYSGNVAIVNAAKAQAAVSVPSDAAGKNIHVICCVRDDGAPALVGYRRIVIIGEAPSGSTAQSVPGNIRPKILIRTETGRKLRICVGAKGEFMLRVCSIDGRLLTRHIISGRASTLLPVAGSDAVCMVTILQGAFRVTCCVAMLRS